jgi:gamma-glutamyl:cysteine ligase YbdK (ATP-grasp superfamily)
VSKYRLFEVFGIELEYMIVDKSSLKLAPVADQLFKKAMGEIVNDVTGDRVDWSNELVMHVAEFKNSKPERNVPALLPFFNNEIKRANDMLQEWNCQLLPTAMHPLMNPETDTKLWPHGNNEIYSAYDRIFSCKGHGWSNLQSMHINISFATDSEFGALHSSIRALLPLIPAMSSSSPIYEGQIRENKSSRLNFYFQNQKRIPSILGLAVPEVIKTPADYEAKVLQPMYKEISPFDSAGLLQHEWLNSRAAIPKFEYGCIEIRLADIQETPAVDLAIATFWTQALRQLAAGSWLNIEKFDAIPTAQLRQVLNGTVRSAEEYQITDLEYLKCFGFSQSVQAKELLRSIFLAVESNSDVQSVRKSLEKLLLTGSLSTRLLRALPKQPKPEEIQTVYKELMRCLETGAFFAH